jgi:heavy metal sensor kinase
MRHRLRCLFQAVRALPVRLDRSTGLEPKGRPVSAIPIRLRLSLAFALAMAVLLASLGGFLYFRLRSELNEQLVVGLRAHSDAVAALVRRDGELGTGQPLVEESETFAQVIGADGRVADASLLPVRQRPLLTGDEFGSARSGTVSVERRSVPGLDDNPYRLLGTPVDGVVVVTGASLEDRDEALASLLTELLVGGPVVLLLSSLAGYALAAAALRPVEGMRRRAAEISSETAGRRLPLPPARDELLRLGETLNDMLERLEAGLLRERRFVADASHELRTPLALLETELELALRRPRSPDELRSALASAAEEVDRLTQLAEDLLVLARADEGQLPLRRTSIPVRELFESVARRFELRAAEQGRSLAVSGTDGEHIVADRLRLEQALGNLLDNALRHGGGTVRLEAQTTNGTITLRVSDEGAGFPPDFLPRAFERFAREDEARGRGATGLGLAIVAAVVGAHGGAAHASNGPGGGASVSLAFPAD